ncbi:hypothetical protein FHR73_003624 [Pseudomonas sp. AS2.8]|nr:hypothetical protein [Pseudomonas sp. AS2.8]
MRRGRRQHRAAVLSQESHDSDSANRPGRSARAPRARG